MKKDVDLLIGLDLYYNLKLTTSREICGDKFFVEINFPGRFVEIQFFVEINLRKKKWLLCCSYNPHKSNITNHLKNICKTLDKRNSTYDNLVLLGDFNAEPEGKHF